ncbi:hypothetical protein D3C71_1995090 [compost metagenome]
MAFTLKHIRAIDTAGSHMNAQLALPRLRHGALAQLQDAWLAKAIHLDSMHFVHGASLVHHIIHIVRSTKTHPGPRTSGAPSRHYCCCCCC